MIAWPLINAGSPPISVGTEHFIKGQTTSGILSNFLDNTYRVGFYPLCIEDVSVIFSFFLSNGNCSDTCCVHTGHYPYRILIP